ncbi:MAG: prepilin-type N-terminal cleavage/methylation domain-containing protein [Lachnospiraceae bacterium]|nr:prepilin-type N-terminal cleavage/methylation domain-containing protein [Lachnospiraceae bacterium]
MKKSNNRGVSLIEILIAVVVFVICITPIINQLAAGIRLGQKADDQQAATDYGKSVSESIKQMNLDEIFDLQKGYCDKPSLIKLLELDTSEAITMSVSCDFYSFDETCIKRDSDGNYLYELDNTKVNGLANKIAKGSHIKVQAGATPNMTIGTGPEYNSVTDMYKALDVINLTAANKQALVRQYTITTVTKLNGRKYDVSMVLDNLPFAINSLVKTGYTDPNSVNLGNMSSLNADTTAVIISTSNYDAVASSAYLASALSAMEQHGNSTKATQLRENNSGVVSEFTSEELRPTKDIYITVSKGGGSYPYKVECEVVYTGDELADRYDIPPSEKVLSYPAFSQSFKEMPDVYLMYNQYVYINNYGNDNIHIDNQVSDEKVKFYVIRTADQDEDHNSLIKSGSNVRDRVDSGTGNYVYRTIFDITKSITSNPVEIYTNIISDRSNVNGSLTTKNTKIAVLTVGGGDEYKSVLRLLEDDERYSDAGRAYNVYIELKNTQSNTVTTYSTSKGDY